MKVDLTPKSYNVEFDTRAGSYAKWLPSDVPMLRIANVGGSVIHLKTHGFALPRYSDSSKVAYVRSGNGTFGVVFPGEKEKVIPIKEGDAIIIPSGIVTWWYNDDEDDNLNIILLGETCKAQKRGEFTDIYLSGPNGIFSGLSSEFASQAWGLKEDEVKNLLKHQTGKNIVKKKAGTSMPTPKYEDRKGLVVNLLESKQDEDTKKGGHTCSFHEKNLPLAKQVGLSGNLVTLEKHAMYSPGFFSVSAYQVIHITKGSGHVQIVGLDGKRVLDTKVNVKRSLDDTDEKEKDQLPLFVVPRFHVVSIVAGDKGLQMFSMVTSPNFVLNELGGSNSILKALSPQVIENAFNVTSSVAKQLQSKRESVEVILPPLKK
ncbi:hypothetical protein AQUCO_07200161v1 [Aquilegia coerulea]|uniref:Cupin type-1 domain-containing protein n=1 Tax=Aquilegia coerulea TaxID=218851 RepID=A0A2G5CAL1_AQUCA|nr:hypothetical protein AQUCO_07200161v1 [Aquilegia coerulea]